MNQTYYEIIKRKIDLFLSTFITESENVFWRDKRLIHPGEYGMYRERCLKELLKSVIPEKYRIGDGFIINVEGTVSTQCDILIYDPNIIPTMDNDVARFYPAEGISAIIEVKSTLSKSGLSSALYKMALNKQLFRNRENTSEDTNKKVLNQLYPSTLLVCKEIKCDDLNELDEKFFEKTYGDIPRCFWHNGILSLEDGIIWYKINSEQLGRKDENGMSASYSQPIIGDKKLDIQVVNAREDVYYHIMSFLGKVRDDIDYVEKFEFPILEYLGLNNEKFERKIELGKEKL